MFDAIRYGKLKKLPLTAEEKARWAGMFHATWNAIGYDAEPGLEDAKRHGCRASRASLIVEMVCDANRVEEFGGMTKEEYAFLSAIYHRRSFQQWARGVLNY